MLDAADLRYGGGRGELRQARHHQALFYMGSIAEQLDLEMPGALPEISPSPEYDPFVDFRERAIHHFLGISPDVPAGSLSVVPDVPDSWLGLSVENLRVGSGTAAASASRRGKRYTTEVSAPAGYLFSVIVEIVGSSGKADVAGTGGLCL